jgi:hypothetical protein
MEYFYIGGGAPVGEGLLNPYPAFPSKGGTQ